MRRPLAGATLVVLLAGCTVLATPSRSPSAVATPSPTLSIAASASVVATPTPEPSLSLAPPADNDTRQVALTVTPAVTDAGGRITVTVTNQSDRRIDEIVLRWPTALGEALVLAPFQPSNERIREGGLPLTASTHWTKWVDGPGEHGEPAGTTSLGYGPMDPGMTLEIPLFVTRRAPGGVAFDLQALAGEALLTNPDGRPAEVRVVVP